MRRRFFGETQINFNRYCTIKGNEDNVEVTYSKDVFYTVNYKNWNLLLENTSIVINKNQLVSFKAVEGTTQSGLFKISGKCDVLGTVMSLIDSDNLSHSAFEYLFRDCINIQTVSKHFLPLTLLSYYCYFGMFLGCTGLIQAPELPATILTSHCYSNMFQNCTSLINAPELPATTLSSHCYDSMFRNCTSLEKVPCIKAEILNNYACLGMFSGCTNLKYIKANFIVTSNYSTHNWMYGITTTGTFIKDSYAMWDNSIIPTTWNVEIEDNGFLDGIEDYKVFGFNPEHWIKDESIVNYNTYQCDVLEYAPLYIYFKDITSINIQIKNLSNSYNNMLLIAKNLNYIAIGLEGDNLSGLDNIFNVYRSADTTYYLNNIETPAILSIVHSSENRTDNHVNHSTIKIPK